MYPSYESIPRQRHDLLSNPPINSGRTYKWFDGAVLPFGYVLHYTNFSANASINFPSLQDTADIIKRSNSKKYIDQFGRSNLVVNVHNVGDLTSDYVALAFVSGEYRPLPRPRRELVTYSRIAVIEPGSAKTASLPIKLGASSTRWDGSGRRVLYPGVYKLALHTEPELAVVEFEITGSEVVIEKFAVANEKI